MSKSFRYLLASLLITLLWTQSQAQETTNFYEQIKNYDLSVALGADNILIDTEDGEEIIQRSEILGFIGDTYQRFHIHFISVIQNPSNPYEYFAYGKTKVKGYICSFQGTIKVVSSEIYKKPDVPGYKEGFANCEVELYEDKKQATSGFFKGNLVSDFCIDKKGQFRYNALMFVADGFFNNQFTGSWTSYKTNTSKRCNWGDYRIPDCGDLDTGTGEFMVDKKYFKNGWENYEVLYGGQYSDGSPEVKKAIQKENEKWWK